MDDDGTTLRADTLAALQEFLLEQKLQKAREEAEAEDTNPTLATSEDWELSQFWYDEETSVSLATELVTLAESLHDAGKAIVKIACISCPSIYKAYRALVDRGAVPAYVQAMLWEYDTRFACFGDEFQHYDFNKPLTFPPSLAGTFDIVAVDPPFLNPDCLGEFAKTVRALQCESNGPVMLCTGSVMLPHARALLGLRPTREHVGHAKRLQNPFSCFVNYTPARLGGYDLEAEDVYAKAQDAAAAAVASSSDAVGCGQAISSA